MRQLFFFSRTAYIAAGSSTLITCALYVSAEGRLKHRAPENYATLVENPEDFHKRHYRGERFKQAQSIGAP